MRRADLQALAKARVLDATALMEAGRWAGAYYLLGYAIECALKACAATQIQEHEMPDRQIVNDFYTHSFDKLLSVSGVKDSLLRRSRSDPRFAVNWNIVHDWKAESRYDNSATEAKARDMLTAVTDPASGVLPWLRTQW